MNYYEHIGINRNAYLVVSTANSLTRTYACADRGSLDALILKLTSRSVTTYPQDNKGLPIVNGIKITYPLHIYGSKI